ncbi:sugar ABC transporter substrate-binding protein [Robertmurraya korlensis]|uniref:sugar ABC transporter substrate-binding protein n=1 Tax=Robertmurraya korlensis TaxID=519977 RepID=UPI000824E8FF|nr:sugar ABC transporter substrate-binding protein [Robertmurraya korlensis]
MKFHKSIVIILSLIVSLVLSACNRGEQVAGGSDSKKVIGIAEANMSNEFITYMIDAMKEEDKKHSSDFEFVYTDAQNDSAKQMNQIENFISRKVDAIIFNPVDTVAAVDIVSRANEAGIPIIVVNRTFDGVDKATAYAGSQSIESGLIQMEEVAKQMSGKGNIAIMDGEMGHEAQIKRTEGNKEIISKNPDMKVVLQGTAKFSRADGIKLMENWLQTGEKIDAVVANNDEMAIGAIMALEEAGKLDEILVAGIDATPAGLEFVKNGKLKVTVFQNATGQGKAAIDLAVKAAKGEKVEDQIIPYELVTKDNVDEFIAKYNK